MKCGNLEGFVDRTWQVVHDSGELAAAAQVYQLTNLNGDADIKYRLISRVINNYNGAANVSLYFNSDSGNNYGYQYVNGVNTTVAAGRGTPSAIIQIGAFGAINQLAFSDTLINAKSGVPRTIILKAADSISGTTVSEVVLMGQSWNNSADNLTSISITHPYSNGLGIGSRFILLKEVHVDSGLRTGELDIRGTLKGAWQEVYRCSVAGSTVNPVAQSTDYVKATSYYSANFYPHFATDMSKPLAGAESTNQWDTTTVTNQRFHIDIGSAKIVKKIYYENAHNSGANTDRGVKNFTLWGSNSATAFAELTYGTDTGWTQLTTDVSQLAQHAASDASDPKYINVTNSVAYRYYAFKFADTWGSVTDMALRKISLRTEAGTNEFENVQTSITVSGLLGNTLDQVLRVRVRAVNGYNGAAVVNMYINGDQTAGHYGYQVLSGSSTTASAGRDTNAASIVSISNSGTLNYINHCELLLYAKSGFPRTVINETVYNITGTTVDGIQLLGQVFNNTSDEITQIAFTGSQANALGIGTEIVIERLNL